MPQLIVSGKSYEVSAVLLDKDGTIVKFVELWGGWSKQLLLSFSQKVNDITGVGIQLNAEKMIGVQLNEQGEVKDYDRNGMLAMGTIENLLTILAWHGYQEGLSFADAKTIAVACYEETNKWLAQTKPVVAIEGVVEFLQQCYHAGIKLAVVTADETAAAVEHLQWLGIDVYFNEIIGTDQVTLGKPFPDMVLLACHKLDVEPAKVIVIGDTDGDMLMGKAARVSLNIGISPYPVEQTTWLDQADIMINHYNEVTIALER